MIKQKKKLIQLNSGIFNCSGSAGERLKGHSIFLLHVIITEKSLALFKYSCLLWMSHLSGKDYSNVFLDPLR